MKKRVVIIGGGAAGIAACISAAQGDTEVILLEHQDRIGKKILMTGNGKCNLTNMDMDSSHYVTADAKDVFFVQKVLELYPPQKLLDFFHSIGLRTTVLRETYIYPETEAAATVVNVFLRELNRLGVQIHTNEQIVRLSYKKGRTQVVTDHNEYCADAVILACGGKSYPKTGSDGSSFDLLKKLQLPVIAPYPALTSLICKRENLKMLSGLRTNATVTLLDPSGEIIRSQYGQIQFTDYGLSGIPVFQISSTIYPYCRQTKCRPDELTAIVDLFPFEEEQQLFEELLHQFMQYADSTAEEALDGFLHKKWIAFFIRQCGLHGILCRDLDKKEIRRLAKQLKKICFSITDLKGFDFCQVTGGGLPLNAINDHFELIRYPGIYVVGEMLNVTGDCGGYNLHWAFSGGLIAGCDSAKTGN